MAPEVVVEPLQDIYETPIFFDNIFIRKTRRFENHHSTTTTTTTTTASESINDKSLLRSREIHDRAFIRVRRNRMSIIFEELNESTADNDDGDDNAHVLPEYNIPRLPPPKAPHTKYPPRQYAMSTRQYKRLQGARNQKESLEIDRRSDWRIYRIAPRVYLPRPFLQPLPSSLAERMRWAVERVLRRMRQTIGKSLGFLVTPPHNNIP